MEKKIHKCAVNSLHFKLRVIDIFERFESGLRSVIVCYCIDKDSRHCHEGGES